VQSIDEDRLTRLVLLLVILAVLLIVPLRIIAYGYMPPDDALRHSAFAVANRAWGDVMLLDPRFPAWMDPHPGWHAFLRAVHEVTQWDQGWLVSVSVVLAYWTFTFAGTVASGNPPAWLVSLGLLAVLDPALLGKLTYGRPLFFTMTAVLVLNFVWTRRQPLRLPLEIGVSFLMLAASLSMHPTSWYLWAIAIPPLAACRQWRALGSLAVGWGLALALTILLHGWYNTVVLPIEILRVAVLAGGTLGPNLVPELQPSGAPLGALAGAALLLLARKAAGHDLREEWGKVDLAFLVTAWVLGLYVSRFWVEWGLPAMAVWYTRQVGEGLGIGFFGPLPRRSTAMLVGVAAATLYLGQTADIGGRYTNALRSPVLIAPLEEIAAELPEPGGVLYAGEMGAFFSIFHRLPNVPFRFSTGMEPGLMPAADLAVLRAIQTTGLTRDYQPWFEKMGPADRVLMRGGAAPQWPGMEFRPYFGAWMGRRVQP
jgi:hypothetical protein